MRNRQRNQLPTITNQHGSSRNFEVSIYWYDINDKIICTKHTVKGADHNMVSFTRQINAEGWFLNDQQTDWVSPNQLIRVVLA